MPPNTEVLLLAVCMHFSARPYPIIDVNPVSNDACLLIQRSIALLAAVFIVFLLDQN